ISEHIKQSPYPVIVCGDFNDTPVSYTYHKMRGQLTDAFINAGNGFGNTYERKIASFRIDYIFHSPEFDSKNFKVPHLLYSDHFPVVCDIEIVHP
ncbi:MAG: endonuclease/exonuclease/phosphatase family protein, partial [Bacteroidota bacterium]